MKKVLSMILAAFMLASAVMPALAADEYVYPATQATADKVSWFDYACIYNDAGAIERITGFRIGFIGQLEQISLYEFSDLQLLRDNAPVKVTIDFLGSNTGPAYSGQEHTEFFVKFTEVLTESGIYKLNFKFQNVKFQMSPTIIDGKLSDIHADKNALISFSCTFGTHDLDYYVDSVADKIYGMDFTFTGKQDVFDLNDLTDLRLDRNGGAATFRLSSHVWRFRFDWSGDGNFDTQFQMSFEPPVSTPGVYVFSGKYQGKDFRSETLIILTSKQAQALGGAHEWARQKLAYAVGHDLVDEDIAANFAASATRAEFCRLAVRYLESKKGVKIADFLKTKANLPNVIFADTSDAAIIAAAKLGIVSGVGKGRFNPDGLITRQEAASMIANLQAAMGVDVKTAPKVVYKDSQSISPWAASAVNYTSQTKIMRGDGVYFRPLDNITREESVIAFENFY